MALNNGINVRFDPEVRERLEAVAQRFGVKSSVLIRLAVLEKLESIEAQATIVLKPKESVAPPRPEPTRAPEQELVGDEKKNY